ncbi:MAG: hypothetical protein M3O35_19600 [Acidobacteriota bacterium]|nr:hypothetical protein [Acidobacteriota bacterium]
MRVVAAFSLILACIPHSLAAATLTPETERAFDRYVALTEQRLQGDLNAEHFLWLHSHPAERAKVRNGEMLILPRKTTDQGKDIHIPSGLVQDWYGAIFIAGATVPRVRAVMQDYPNYQNIYRPEVTESRLVNHNGNDYDVFLRLFKKHMLTVVLNSTYRVHYGELDERRLSIASKSTRIAEVKDAKKSNTEEEPVGNDNGFLWRLNSYWRFEEADGGVYAECEAISLSRDIPFGLGWMIKTIVERFPKESMVNTLKGTQKAVRGG